MLINIEKLSKELNVSKSSLRRWEKDGIISSLRTTGNHRRYDENEIKNIINNQTLMQPSNNTVCCYSRVSTHEQKNDLARQKQTLEMFCNKNGLKYFSIEDIGSALNYNKKGLNELIELIINKKISKIILTHKDRLVRFGYEIISNLCKHNNIEIVFINQNVDNIDDNKEFVDDVLSIITHFSSKLYGKRSHKNKTILAQNKQLFSDKFEEKIK